MQITLKAARINSGYTLAAASQKIGVSIQTLINYECGKSVIPADKYISLCDLYNIPVISKVSIPNNKTNRLMPGVQVEGE